MTTSGNEIPSRYSRRVTLWRILLAGGLGVVTWWCVSWFQAARPLYTLKYPAKGNIERRIGDRYQLEISFRIAPFDSAGKWFIMQRPRVPDDEAGTVDLIECATGKTVASHVLRHVKQRGWCGVSLDNRLPIGTTPRGGGRGGRTRA
jgi:hypothetical protein